MSITVAATYENGVLKLMQPLPLKEHEQVEVTIRRPGSEARIAWTGPLEDLDYLIRSEENGPAEGT
jgi:predicted DNA-binding antitoxin AbrB/MazE fold protein